MGANAAAGRIAARAIDGRSDRRNAAPRFEPPCRGSARIVGPDEHPAPCDRLRGSRRAGGRESLRPIARARLPCYRAVACLRETMPRINTSALALFGIVSLASCLLLAQTQRPGEYPRGEKP